jgi:serine/threonine protein kinase
MTRQPQAEHPTADTLAAFALGHLADNDADAVADHLDGCESCQRAVLAVPDDSMLSLLRPAGGSNTPLPVAESQAGTAPVFEADVPPELHDHARYQVLQRLGAGGMGVVYKAEHRLMARTVALKVISKRLTEMSGVVERFRREVQAVARLSHPNLVQAYDAEQAGELHFLVMEFVPGQSLAWLVDRDGPLSVEKACDCVRQAAVGLGHALAQGLVHRDVKPQNLMLTPQGQVKVLDFGLASLVAEQGGDGGLTETGQGMGTPDYMAPEQIRDAHSVDTRADVYSLGCTLYFLLAGRPPFPEGDSRQKVAAHLEKQPTPLPQLRPGLPAGLVQVVERMMAKAPARRYQTPAEVAAALEPFCRPVPVPKPRRAWLGWVAAVAGLLVVPAGLLWVALTVLRPDTEPKRPEGEDPALLPNDTPDKPLPGVKPGDKARDLGQVMPLIDDDFSDPDKSHFPTAQYKDTGNESRFETGRYVLRRGGRTDAVMSSPQQGVEGDFACQVVGRARTGGNSGWGLLLFPKEPDPQVMTIRLSPDGFVEVGTFFPGRPGSYGVVAGPIRHSAIKTGDKENTLLVVLRGGQTAEIYVNGVAISRPIQLKQRFGVPVWQSVASWSREAEFTRFMLWLLPPPETGEGQPAPDLGKVDSLIDDHFEPNKSGFPKDRNERGERFFEKGNYVMRHARKRAPGEPELYGALGHSLNVIDTGSGDLACQVEGCVLSERDAGWAVGFLAKDRDLAIRLRRDGAVEVGNFVWDQATGPRTMVGPIRHPVIHLGNEFNTLLVILHGGQTLEIYVNGSAITRPIRLEQPLGDVAPGLGLWERCGHTELKGRVEFKRFTVWKLPPTKPKP